MRVSSRTLLAGVAGCVGLFGLILVLAYLAPGARELDAKALEGFLGLQRPKVTWLTTNVVRLGDPLEVGVIGVALATVALLRGRPRVAFAVIVLLAATSVSSQLLKELLEYPRYVGGANLIVGPEAFPSGHSTAAMALAIAGVMVAPSAARPLAALVGAGLAVGVGISVVALGWHFASDVAGGFLLATGWGLLLALALRWAEARWPQRTFRGRAATAVRQATDVAATAGLAALVAAGVVLVATAVIVIAVTRPGDVMDLARGHTAAVLVGAALVALAMGLLGGISAAVRRRG